MKEIEYPITVKEIKFSGEEVYEPHASFRRNICGQMVAVRPCADEYENKTYLGILLGSIALSQGCSWKKETGTLTISRYIHNPMIFIPEKNAVVFGCGSWWGPVKDAEHLRQITNEDIQNVWYVKALKEISEREAKGPEKNADGN